MPSSDDILGSTASLNASGAIESVQAEEIQRLQQQKDQTAAFTPSSEWQAIPAGTPVPPGGDFRMDMESGQNFGRWTGLSPTPSAPPLGRSSFDAEAANARAASRPMASFPARGLDTTISAPANAGASFDAAAYDQAIRSQLQQAGITPPAKADPQGVLSQDELTSLLAQRQASVAPAVPAPRPLSPYPTYEDAAQTKADILNDARNLYTARGDFGSIGSPMFQAELGEAYQSAGLAPPMEKPSPFQEAHAQASDLTADLRDTYAAQGRYGEIGQSGFQKDLAATLRQVGLGVPEEKPRPFQEVQAQVSALTDDLKDSYTAQGRYAEIGQAGFREELAGSLHQAGLGPEPKDPGLSGAYKEQAARRQSIEAAVKDTYTLRGDFAKVGGTEYQADLQSSYAAAGINLEREGGSYRTATLQKAEVENAFKDELTDEGKFAEIGTDGYKKHLRSRLADAGLAEKDTVWNRIKEDKTGIAFGIGYSAMSAGSGLSELAKLNDGQFHTQEQVATAQFNAVAPAGFGIAGTVIGTAIGGAAGGLAGQFVGGAVGQVASATFGAGEERAQSERQSAETLAHSLSEAASSVAAFKSQIEATGAPVQQFAASLSAAGQVGTFSGGTVAGIGALTNSFGERAGEDYQAIGKYTTNPLLHGLGSRFSTGQAEAGDLQSLGFDAAENDDFAGLKTFQQAAQDARVKNNPVYQAAAKRLQGDSNSLFGLGDLGVAGTKFLRDHGYRPNTDINADLQTEDDQKAASGTDPVTDAQNALINQFADLKSRSIVADSTIKTARAGIALVEAQGGSAQDIAKSSQSLFSADAAGRAATTSEISLLQKDLANPINAGRRDELTARIADAQSRMASFDVTDAQQVQGNNAAVFDQNAAAFSRTASTQQAAIQAGFYGGRTFAQLQGSENSILRTEQSRAAELRREAYAPNVDPAERDKKLAEATGMDAGVVKEQHDFQQNVYRQAAAQDDLTVGRAGLGVEQARAFGTEASVYGAQGQEADALRAKMAELTRQLAAGGNSADETAEKMRQITQAGGQLNSVLAQQRDERLAAQQSVASSQFQQDTAGLGRQVQIGGSGAVNIDTINADFQKRFAADQAAINEYKPGDPRHDAAQAKLAQDRAESRDYEGGLTRYTPSAQTSIQGLAVEDETERARHAFQREMLTPYRTGDPNSDPLTRGLGLEKALDKSAAFVDTQAQAATAYRSAQQNKVGADGKPLWDPLAEENYQRQMIGFHDQKDSLLDQRAQVEHDRLWEEDRRLPEMIAGGGGLSGNSVLAVPQAALSAFFHPSMRDGSWGHPVTQPGLSRPGSLPGNAYDGFQDHNFQQHSSPAGAAASSASGSSASGTIAALQTLAHGMNTQQLATIMQQVLQTLQRMEAANRTQMPSQGGPPLTGGSRTIQNNQQSFNPNRPSQR